jgi:hypothetical protein
MDAVNELGAKIEQCYNDFHKNLSGVKSKSSKVAVVRARKCLMDLKKMCHSMRSELQKYKKTLPVKKRIK